jgi:hypothetical protein
MMKISIKALKPVFLSTCIFLISCDPGDEPSGGDTNATDTSSATTDTGTGSSTTQQKPAEASFFHNGVEVYNSSNSTVSSAGGSVTYNKTVDSIRSFVSLDNFSANQTEWWSSASNARDLSSIGISMLNTDSRISGCFRDGNDYDASIYLALYFEGEDFNGTFNGTSAHITLADIDKTHLIYNTSQLNSTCSKFNNITMIDSFTLYRNPEYYNYLGTEGDSCVGTYTTSRCQDYTWGFEYGAYIASSHNSIRDYSSLYRHDTQYTDTLDITSLDVNITNIKADSSSTGHTETSYTVEFLDHFGNTQTLSGAHIGSSFVELPPEDILNNSSAYFVRTDIPGTILKIDGGSSYSCSWRDCPNGLTCGIKVNGAWDSSINVLTFQFPDNNGNTNPLEFTSSVGYTGINLFLNGYGAGEYQKVASYNEATQNDIYGYCSNLE